MRTSAERKLTNIMCMDIVGYSKMMNQDEHAALNVLQHARDLVDPCITRFGGRIFNTAGDSVLAEFTSTVEMVKCAIACQTQFKNSSTKWRIGLHLGDVAVDGTNLLGDGVNVCARIEGLADYGGISMSDIVHRGVVNLVQARYIDQGRQALKNIPQPMQLWGIVIDGMVENKSRNIGGGIDAKQIKQDASLVGETLEKALALRRSGDYETATKILLHRSLNQDKSAWAELVNMTERKLVPVKYYTVIASILDAMMRIADHRTTFAMANNLAAYKLGSEYTGRAVQHWQHASEMIPEAAIKLAEYVFADKHSSESEIIQAQEYLMSAARTGLGEAALLLGKNLKTTDKKASIAWLLVARYLRMYAAQGLIESISRGMSHADIVSAKIDGDALIDEIKWARAN